MAGLKKLVQAGFHAVGLHVSYNKASPDPPKSGWHFFFAALKAKGFNGLGHAASLIQFCRRQG